MIGYAKYVVWFVLMLLVQSFVFDQIILPFGVVIAAYVWFILILPFQTPRFWLLCIAMVLGMSIDAFNDSYGLHTSAILVLAYLRSAVFSWLEPAKNFYDNKSTTDADIPVLWYFKSYGLLIFIYALWFHFLSVFRIAGFWFTLQKAVFTALATFTVIFVFQIVLMRKEAKNEL
jgi:hypothetical protein